MPIELNPTLLAFAQALAADAALSAWSQAAYGRAHKVFVNIDIRNPPGEAECPYLMLRPVSARYGRGVTEKTIAIELSATLYDESSVTHADTGLVEYNGVRNCIEFLDLAVTAIAAVDTGNALLQDVEAEFETIEFFPFFMTGAPIVIVEPLTLSADRLAL